MRSIKLDSKYEVFLNAQPGSFVFEARRYGETWRNLVGDNLVLAMFHRIEELEEESAKLKKEAAN
ncbi:hypothetical protein [Paenibacillus naphthalenovorans]|uniref:hypothetical protein n=1 Tax=Paenibacillus naphthalenovorans TaxID=162209 RepID=UPI003D2E98D7